MDGGGCGGVRSPNPPALDGRGYARGSQQLQANRAKNTLSHAPKTLALRPTEGQLLPKPPR
jgi:hypothetical protein